MSDMLKSRVEKIEFSEILPCLADSARIRIVADTNIKLEEVLPVLYLYIPNSTYSSKAGSLSYMLGPHLVTLFVSGKIAITYLKDEEEARQLLEIIKNLINRAFAYIEEKGKIGEEQIKAKKKLSPIEVYSLLPRTNCKECGEESCYTYAVKLVSQERALEDCKPLLKDSVKKKKLEDALFPVKI